MKKFAAPLIMALSLTACGPPNAPPQIISFTAQPATIHLNGASQLTCEAIDEHEEDLIYLFTSSGGSINHLGSGKAVFLPFSTGLHIVECNVTDDKGATDRKSLIIRVIK